jgi:hypothetical protein
VPAAATAASAAIPAAGAATVAGASAASVATPAPPAAAEPAAPPAVPAERKPFPWIWVALGALVVALAAGGYFVGHSGGKKASTSSGDISVQNATVGIPSGWHEVSAPKIPHLPLRQAVAASPESASSGLVMGLASLAYPWLLPNALIGHEAAQAKTSYNSRPNVVTIGPLQASRTSGVSFAKSGKPLYTFIYFPQGKSSTTMAVCYSKTGSVSELVDCEKAASAIRISGAKLYDLVPSKTYATSLGAALSKLTKSEQSGLKALKSAKTTAAQATAARTIAAAYTSAAGTVRKLKATAYAQPANKKIATALAGVAGAYKSLASAAAKKSSSAYSAASKKVASAEQTLADAVSELKSLGYAVS